MDVATSRTESEFYRGRRRTQRMGRWGWIGSNAGVLCRRGCNLRVRLSVCPLAYLKNYATKLHEILSTSGPITCMGLYFALKTIQCCVLPLLLLRTQSTNGVLFVWVSVCLSVRKHISGTTHLVDCNFIIRMSYMNAYWLNNGLFLCYQYVMFYFTVCRRIVCRNALCHFVY